MIFHFSHAIFLFILQIHIVSKWLVCGYKSLKIGYILEMRQSAPLSPPPKKNPFPLFRVATQLF